MANVVRVANCSRFYGDRLSAAKEMVEGGPIDALTGDYLAELTMAILHKQRSQGRKAGGYVGEPSHAGCAACWPDSLAARTIIAEPPHCVSHRAVQTVEDISSTVVS